MSNISNTSNDKCFICLDETDNKVCPQCNCFAHDSCWGRYIASQTQLKCPVCRIEIEVPENHHHLLEENDNILELFEMAEEELDHLIDIGDQVDYLMIYNTIRAICSIHMDVYSSSEVLHVINILNNTYNIN